MPVRYYVDGQKVDVADEKLEAFLQQYPKAMMGVPFSLEQKELFVPADKVGQFQTKYPDAVPTAPKPPPSVSKEKSLLSEIKDDYSTDRMLQQDGKWIDTKKGIVVTDEQYNNWDMARKLKEDNVFKDIKREEAVSESTFSFFPPPPPPAVTERKRIKAEKRAIKQGGEDIGKKPVYSVLGSMIQSFKELAQMKKEGRLDIFTDALRKELEDKPLANAFITGLFGERANIGQQIPEAKTISEKVVRGAAGLAGVVISFAPVAKATRYVGVGARIARKHGLIGRLIGSAETFVLHGQIMKKGTDYTERLKQAGQDLTTGLVFGLAGGLGKDFLKGTAGKVVSYPAMFGIGFGMSKAGDSSNEDAIINGALLVALHGIFDIGGKAKSKKFLADKLKEQGIEKPESVAEEAFKQAEEFKTTNPKEYEDVFGKPEGKIEEPTAVKTDIKAEPIQAKPTKAEEKAEPVKPIEPVVEKLKKVDVDKLKPTKEIGRMELEEAGFDPAAAGLGGTYAEIKSFEGKPIIALHRGEQGIDGFAVHKDYQKQGIATEYISKLVEMEGRVDFQTPNENMLKVMEKAGIVTEIDKKEQLFRVGPKTIKEAPIAPKKEEKPTFKIVEKPKKAIVEPKKIGKSVYTEKNGKIFKTYRGNTFEISQSEYDKVLRRSEITKQGNITKGKNIVLAKEQFIKQGDMPAVEAMRGIDLGKDYDMSEYRIGNNPDFAQKMFKHEKANYDEIESAALDKVVAKYGYGEVFGRDGRVDIDKVLNLVDREFLDASEGKFNKPPEVRVKEEKPVTSTELESAEKYLIDVEKELKIAIEAGKETKNLKENIGWAKSEIENIKKLSESSIELEIESEIPKLESTLKIYDSQITELKKTKGNDLKISRVKDSKKRVQEILEQDNNIQNGLSKFTVENVKKVYKGAVKTGRYKFENLDKKLQLEGKRLGINETNFTEKFEQFTENPKLSGKAVQNFFKETWTSIKKAWKDEGGFIRVNRAEEIKLISKTIGLDKNKIDKETNKYKKTQKKETHDKISEMIFKRRTDIDVANFESSLFTHGIEDYKIKGKKITKEQLEVVPFLLEKTSIPKNLNRPELEVIYKEQRTSLEPVVKEVKQHFDKMWQKIVENTDQLSEKQIENYVTHIWDIPKNKKTEVTNWFSTKNRFLNKRYIDTLEEGINKFDLKPKLLNIADIIRVHDGVANSVIENTKFINNLKALTREGLPLILRSDKAPPDWITTKHPALTTTMLISGKEGSPNKLIKVPYKIHPDLKNPVEVIFGGRFGHPAIKVWEKIDAILKKTALSLSFFHHGALLETGIAKMSPIKVGKVLAKETAYRQIKDRGKANPILSYPKETREAISYGVQFGHTLDIDVRGIQKSLDNITKKTENVPVLNRGTKILSSFNRKWDKNLWDYTHDPLKLYAFIDAKAKIPKNVDKEIYLREQARLINDTFGGQNWDVLMVSPKTQQIMRWFLLSPDWTISTVRQALSVTSFGAKSPEGRAIRAKAGGIFWLKAGFYFGIGINMLNMYYRERDIQENPELYPKDMGRWDKTMFNNTIGHKTHLFTGRYDDGSERYMRWGKQFRELPELIMDDEGISFPRPLLKKIGGKTAPLVQLSSKVFTGKSPSGYTEWSLKDKKGWNYTWGLIETIAKSPLPFSTQSMFRDDKEWTPTDMMMPSSKGMTKSKTISLFKTGIVQNDIDFVKEVYSGAIRNNLDAYGLFGTALTIVKAEGTKELFADVRTIEDAKKLYKNTKDYGDKRKIADKIGRLRKELVRKKNGFRFLDRAINEMQKIQP